MLKIDKDGIEIDPFLAAIIVLMTFVIFLGFAVWLTK